MYYIKWTIRGPWMEAQSCVGALAQLVGRSGALVQVTEEQKDHLTATYQHEESHLHLLSYLHTQFPKIELTAYYYEDERQIIGKIVRNSPYSDNAWEEYRVSAKNKVETAPSGTQFVSRHQFTDIVTKYGFRQSS